MGIGAVDAGAGAGSGDGRVVLEVISAVMIPSRTTADLLAGMWLLLATQLDAVPRRLIWDNESGIGRRNHLAAGVGEFCGGLATRLQQLKVRDPESKGGVERMNWYFRDLAPAEPRLHLPGRLQRPEWVAGCRRRTRAPSGR